MLQFLNEAFLNRDNIKSPKEHTLIISLLQDCCIYSRLALFKIKVNAILVIICYTIFESAENDYVS